MSDDDKLLIVERMDCTHLKSDNTLVTWSDLHELPSSRLDLWPDEVMLDEFGYQQHFRKSETILAENDPSCIYLPTGGGRYARLVIGVR